jgi:4-oxalocrotonate tautomerase
MQPESAIGPSPSGEPHAACSDRPSQGQAYRQEIGRVVHAAMAGTGIPENDRFQVIGEHDVQDFQFDPSYLQIARTNDLVII